ncbi:MAG: 50S ribosomal protein L24 [Candidatus Heimdallarchaeota archaeon]|nr:50S ribosomal protein L24 [Candidatus Heimdallarchaeota archaeon]
MKATKTKQPRKQRKRYYNAPLHLRNRQMTALLSRELRAKYGVRRLPVHKDDKVIVFRAKSEDQEIKGKVLRVLPQKYSVHIEGHSKEKADGTVTSFPIHPSNILITSLNLRDKKRRDIIKRRSRKEITEEELTEDLFDEVDEPLEETDIEGEDEDLEEDIFEEFEDLDETDVTEAIAEAAPKKETKVAPKKETKVAPKKETKVPDLDISMIKGVGAKTAMLLKENGFDTVDKIAKATSEDLSKVPGIGPGIAKTMSTNAEELLSKKADEKEESA